MGNWYSLVQGIQAGMVKTNLWRLLSIIFRAEVNTGVLSRLPKFDIEFNPLWSVDAVDLADINYAKAEWQRSEAQAAAMYVGMGVVSRKEVRRGLRKNKGKIL